MSQAQKLRIAQNICRYKFKSDDLLWEALQAAGSDVLTLNGRILTGGNKPLAGIGDAVINLATQLHCYQKGFTVGETSTFRSLQVSNHRFALLFDQAGLTFCINANPSQNGMVSPSIKATTLEAIIGAVFKDGGDGGFKAATMVMGNLRIL
ncbi:ribonuclease III domain-containing protein [Whalleya microplaca]|nr:ribonuclease III domain-containing protein [Whalleya microplaca]